ncbi:MAG TPA: DNA polymerase III subunit alpha [Casimicrobiaceae bacterium]|nr:DNA polymerase III subunit alpha [Casimicrobiaceae bacterium]
MSALDYRPGAAIPAESSGASLSGPVAPASLLGALKRPRSESLAGFVHLRLHSEYSIVDGMVRIDEAVGAAVADRMPALALTDLANVFGLVKFYTAARKAGVKPIVGCDVWITHDAERDMPHRLLLLCQSREGYLKLAEWLTRAYRSNQHRGRAEIKRDWFAEGTTGLIALSGFRSGDVGDCLGQGNAAGAARAAAAWARLFPDRYYLEVQRAGHGDDDALSASTARLATELDLPVVATHPVQFLRRHEFRAHEARVCIAEGYTLADARRPKRFTTEQYFTTQDEMAKRFTDMPAAIANSVAIAQRCNLAIPLGKNYLPDFPIPPGLTIEQHLRNETTAGLEKRLALLYPDPSERDVKRPEYVARLEFEAKTIIQMGYAGYFLIVSDFINWAKHNGVPVGPGRGSGAGSLVAYALGITDLDPLRYALLFERFLNPERVSMPDFDIDFCQDGRDKVIEYVKKKYGAESVSQIATFGTLQARAVVRDVGRVLDLPYSFCDGIAKLIPFQPGRTVTLKRRPPGEAAANVVYAREFEPQLNEREAAEEEVRELLALAEQLEGLPRNVGMHAGGVLIAPGKLTDFCPLYTQAGTDALVSQFDKDDVEHVGLVKFDFLGLTTLTILDWTLRYVKMLDPASTLSLEQLPLDDKDAYDIFKSGNTVGVFQFESRGMRELLLQAPAKRFDDIVALVALFRPGPMELIPDYIRRKQGAERVDFYDSRLEPILGPTYGVMVYQEQVMQIAQVIGGYTLGAADLLRRAMGKKLPEEMAKHRFVFIDGAEKNGLSKARATQLFDLMEKFAGYGFNKSHAAAYALIAYQTAYFKAHYPAAFIAANLSLLMDDTDKVRHFRDEAKACGLTVLPPDVSASNYRFEPVDDKHIRYGLGGIKGTGQSAIEAIVKAREGGPFTDLFDFCRRVDKRVVNRRAIEALIRAGACDALGNPRASLLATVGLALEQAERDERSAAQVSLFGDQGDEPAAARLRLIEARDWTDSERLANEKASLGFYLSGHPYNEYAAELASLIHVSLGAIKPTTVPVRIAGVVTTLRNQTSRRGKIAFVTLDDGKDPVEMVVYNEIFDAHRHLLREDVLLIAQVRVQQRMNEDGMMQGLRIIADALYDLPGARRKFARGLKLCCNGSGSAERLLTLLEPYRSGQCPIIIDYRNRAAGGEIELPEAWRVNLDAQLLAQLREWLAPENVKVLY